MAYEEPLIDIPDPIPTMQIPNMQFQRVAGIFDQQFITEQETDQPQHFEAYLQNQGLGIYETTLPVGASGKLIFEHLNDYVQIYLNGEFLLNFTRTHSNKFKFNLPEIKAPGKLEIFVEAMGHINWAEQMETDRKGIFGKVLFNDMEINKWTLHRLPLQNFIEKLVISDE